MVEKISAGQILEDIPFLNGLYSLGVAQQFHIREDINTGEESLKFQKPVITNGLNEVISLRSGEILSKGRITPEMKSNKLPSETEASTPVSSEVNRYPMAIPRKVNTEELITKTRNIAGKATKVSFKKISETPRMMTNWTMIRIKLVR